VDEEVNPWLHLICLFVCLSVRPSIRPSVSPSVRPSIHPSTHLSIYIYLSIMLCYWTAFVSHLNAIVYYLQSSYIHSHIHSVPSDLLFWRRNIWKQTHSTLSWSSIMLCYWTANNTSCPDSL